MKNLAGGCRLWPTVFDLASSKKRIGEIETEQQATNFWQDRERAQRLTQELAELKKETDEMLRLEQDLHDQRELLEMARAESDTKALKDVHQDIDRIEESLAAREKQLRFDGPHDKADAIITIQAGAGGTDAQDWAQMLERMYLRYAERRSWPTTIVNRSLGETAGIKRVTFSVAGKYAFGTLRREHGVHRLVRQSPFNSDSLRQTSFARVEIIPKLAEQELPENFVDTFHKNYLTLNAAKNNAEVSSHFEVKHVKSYENATLSELKAILSEEKIAAGISAGVMAGAE
ncbi:PCRF domain-containing protein [Patescibacteria group bacterium]|nr:PCRF domain-containing protein [Patescibacteria group bacterium]